ncbi:MAG: sigma-54-dependent Fis family transcriptional regulator [Spirochaetales bacterium]|nr:sigma-54-dependent Fis family transcriptional regulator [Spirochaetales bacterium]
MNKSVSDISILIVDDEESLLVDIAKYFLDYNIKTFSEPNEAALSLASSYYDIIVADYRMPGLSGIELLITAKKSSSYHYGILFTAFADKTILEQVINNNLVKRIVEKPVKLRSLKAVIDEAIDDCRKKKEEKKRLEQLSRYYENSKREWEDPFSRIIGLNHGLNDVYKKAKSVSNLSINVFLTGETGTGKELIARFIHEMSPRCDNPFIAINCSAYPENLLESELFGYVKGAFTGAERDKPGKIELSDHGTLFLDEIGELKSNLQVKLLRVIQEKKIERLGSNTVYSVDFRLITATNREPMECIKNGSLREDFYYRINGFPIQLPPLRERREDIPFLVAYFLRKISTELSIPEPVIEESALELLNGYKWPGNIRELENVMMRALILSMDKKVISEESLDPFFHMSGCNMSNFGKAITTLSREVIQKKLELKHIEQYILCEILDYFGGNVKQAVDNTGILKDKFYRNRKK